MNKEHNTFENKDKDSSEKLPKQPSKVPEVAQHIQSPKKPLINEEHDTFENKDKDLSEKLPKQPSKVPEVLQHIQSHLSQVPELVKNVTNTIWEGLTSTEKVDLQQKQQVYDNIAQFLQERLQVDFQKVEFKTYLQTTYILCNESDPQVVGEQPLSELAQKLATKVKDLILTIKVNYLKHQEVPTSDTAANSEHLRQTEIFYIDRNNSKPNVFRVDEQVEWDNLPGDVRESFIKEDLPRISFKLYPQEGS
ncbi:hypothetical protein DP113_05640 [Brasilonema octagenarum UFV-E1]|uniref:Uncharacterized protein n=2 Tax=Brasilonema TaxID=383614 RepID=A0A856MEH8_9CYAN|nr:MULTISPECIES: hypothetical protein [Brasilonema]NMF66129.1 hypothetical protein [Brasilonema octagenarum UFV-OR1]QDL07457.1 hypothetical protein DP114_05685 [Brasilonema sennae CENA114]QDL13819.1 hypothetical protein DP113_05640 [Brasilonema octagenarum UFV-E1]